MISMSLHAGTIMVEGTYQGKNLYIQNPFTSSGIGFCSTDIFVNDIRATDETQSSAFEIDLSVFKFKIGDKVIVKIRHRDDCAPKILNPEALKPSVTFELVSAKADESGYLKWITKNEGGPLPFIIEQYRWNKWNKVGEIPGKGGPEQNAYSLKVSLNSGENKFRIQQTDFKGPHYIGKDIVYKSKIQPIGFYPIKATKDLNFSGETMYEIYDQFGKLVKKGAGLKVDVSSLPQGPYYLNFDNKTENFIRK